MVLVSVDDFVGRKLMGEGRRQWLEDHDNEFQEWTDNNMADDIDATILYHDVINLGNPIKSYLFYLYLKQKDVLDYEKLEIITERIANLDGGIIPIIGQRRQGKTSLCYAICEILHNKYKKKIWWLGVPAKLPKWIDGQTLDENKIPAGAVIIQDEAAIQASSRRSMKTEQVEEMQKLAVISHHNKIKFVLTQNAAIFDITFLRQADAIIFVSQSEISLRNERLIINEYLNYFMPKKKGEALYYDSEMLFQIRWDLPSWWTETFSKPYSQFNSRAEAYKFVLSILKDYPKMNNETIKLYLKMRDKTMEESEIQFIRVLSETYGIDWILSLKDDYLENMIDKGVDETPIQDILKRKDKKIRHYNWTQDPMVKEYWKNKFIDNEDLEIQLKINRNEWLINYIKFLSKQSHIVMYIKGKTGSGKSLGSVSFAEILGIIQKKAWVCNGNLTSSPDEMLELNKNKQKFDTLILDDKRKRHGVGTKKEDWNLQNAVQSLRSFQINFIFNSPEFDETFDCKIYLESYAYDVKANVQKLLLYTPDFKPMGYVTVKRPTQKNEYAYHKFEKDLKKKVQQRDVSTTNPEKEVINRILDKLKNDEEYNSLESRDSKLLHIRMEHGVGSEIARQIYKYYDEKYGK